MNNTVFIENRKIAFICLSNAYGGLEQSVLKLALEFEKRNAECVLIVPSQTPLKDSAEKYNLRVAELNPKLKYGDVIASLKLAHILKSNKIDIVVIMQSKDMSIVTIAHLFNSSTKLVFFQEMQSGIDKRDFLHAWMHAHLSLWITLTEKMKQDVIKYTKMHREKIIVNPIGVDVHRFNPALFDKYTNRNRFGIPQQKIVIGVLGRLDQQKGQEEFIRTIPTLLKHSSDLHFVMAGDETYGQQGFKKKLDNLVNELRVKDYVQFLPATDAVPEFFSAIDVFILPSYSETFGFVLIEAMAMEKAIVATNSGGVPEIIKDGSTGLLVQPRDVHTLAEATLRIIKDQQLKSSLSLNARCEVLKQFEFSQCISQLVGALDIL